MCSAHLPPFWSGIWHLAFQGCQDIIGPIPPSFLISMAQIKTKKIKKNNIFKKFYKFADLSG